MSVHSRESGVERQYPRRQARRRVPAFPPGCVLPHLSVRRPAGCRSDRQAAAPVPRASIPPRRIETVPPAGRRSDPQPGLAAHRIRRAPAGLRWFLLPAPARAACPARLAACAGRNPRQPARFGPTSTPARRSLRLGCRLPAPKSHPAERVRQSFRPPRAGPEAAPPPPRIPTGGENAAIGRVQASAGSISFRGRFDQCVKSGLFDNLNP